MKDLPPDLPSHTYKLPLGYVVTFRWAGGRTSAEWEPHPPKEIRSMRHRRKFMDAYAAARAEYYQMIATAMGGLVAVVDAYDIHGQLNPSVTAIPPACIH